MQPLPIIGSIAEVRGRKRRAKVLQLSRILVLSGVVLLIHFQHQRHVSSVAAKHTQDQSLPLIREVLSEASALEVFATDGGLELVGILDEDGNRIGAAARTSPQSDHIIGFSGPTDVLVVCDNNLQVLDARILSSQDTRDHVQQVMESGLLESLRGKTLSELRSPSKIDGASGATLTSLAILESIRHRLSLKGGDRVSLGPANSLKFPELPTVEDIRSVFPDANSLKFDEGTELWKVLDGESRIVGRLLRSAPDSDNVVGYQGPTDVLIALDSAGKVTRIVVGVSYDNEPYVDYVRSDKYFTELFNGQTVPELAAIDLEQAGIEGVSGATMTSAAVAEGLVVASKSYASRMDAKANQLVTSHSDGWSQLREWISLRDLSTLTIALMGVAFGLSRLKRLRKLRVLFQCLLIVWLGLVNGDLLSQAMWVGWAQNGIPWTNALGLVGLTAVAVLIPVFTGQNTYCAHLCPHGAAQQLLRNRMPWRLKLPRRIERCLRLLPTILLAWVLLVACLHLPFSLVDIEPFDAWLWRIAGPATLAIAIVGLGISLLVPMAYCRYGCPTGKLLDFMRFTHHGKWTLRDSVGVFLLVSALVLCLL